MRHRELVSRRAAVFLARAPDPSSRMAGSQRHFPSLAIDISACTRKAKNLKREFREFLVQLDTTHVESPSIWTVDLGERTQFDNVE